MLSVCLSVCVFGSHVPEPFPGRQVVEGINPLQDNESKVLDLPPDATTYVGAFWHALQNQARHEPGGNDVVLRDDQHPEAFQFTRARG